MRIIDHRSSVRYDFNIKLKVIFFPEYHLFYLNDRNKTIVQVSRENTFYSVSYYISAL